jgi:hypothetical protein
MDNLKPNGTACGSAGACENQDTCSAGVCQDAGFKAQGTACGDPGDTECDDPDTCDGQGTCRPNTAPDGLQCGALGCFGARCEDGTCTSPTTEASLRLLGDKETLSWDLAGPGASFDAARGEVTELPVGSGPSERCLEEDLFESTTRDSETPPTREAFWYLVGCSGTGFYGTTSDGTPRTSGVCP